MSNEIGSQKWQLERIEVTTNFIEAGLKRLYLEGNEDVYWEAIELASVLQRRIARTRNEDTKLQRRR